MRPLVFTPEIRAKAKGEIDALSPLLLQWAAAEGPEGESLRDQIEHAAQLVPEPQRPRVLGPFSVRAPPDQVKAALGSLFLAKTLSDLGWSVDFEPVIGTLTPDLRIQKAGIDYMVEVRRVVGRADEDSRPRMLVQRALKGIRTATPLNINFLQVDGAASLKPFVEHVKSVLSARPVPIGPQRFNSPGVTIRYELSGPYTGDEPIFNAVFGWPMKVTYGNDADRVEAAINEKLRAYKQPIIVALDLDGVLFGFDDVIDAFYGQRKIIVPVRLDGGAHPPGEARLGPMQDGMLVGRHRNAARARERLIALLPFSWGLSTARGRDTFDLYSRVLVNPASEPPSAFAEFAPIPRFVPGERRDQQTIMMGWEPPIDPAGWRHTP